MKSTLKSRRFQLLFVTLLLLLLLFTLLLCVPFLRHRVLRVPIKTDTLFPEPDKIICHYKGTQYTFTDAQMAVLYQILSENETDPTPIEATTPSGSTANTFQLELYYYDNYVYRSSNDTPLASEINGQSFHRILMESANGYLQVALSSYLSKDAVLALDILTFQNWGAFSTTAERLIIASIMQTELWQPENTTPLATATFPAAPDEISLYQNGKAVTLTGEDCREFYDGLMTALGRSGSNQMSAGFSGYSIDCVNGGYLCFELRYRQRQLYQPTDIPPKSEWSTPFEILYRNKSYDTILFVVEAPKDGVATTQSSCQVRIGLGGPSNQLSHNMSSQPSFIAVDFIKSVAAYF